MGSLYELTDSTIEGFTCVTFSIKETNYTQLWHLRLGHMSNRVLLELPKKGLLGNQGFYRVL